MPIMGYWLCFSGRTCLRLTGHTDTHNITIPSQTGLSNFTELGWGSLEIKFGLKSPISKRCYWHRISLLSNHEILENNSQFSKAIVFSQLGWLDTWALFHKTLKTSLHRHLYVLWNGALVDGQYAANFNFDCCLTTTKRQADLHVGLFTDFLNSRLCNNKKQI